VDDGGDATLMVHKGYEVEENPGLLDKIIVMSLKM